MSSQGTVPRADDRPSLNLSTGFNVAGVESLRDRDGIPQSNIPNRNTPLIITWYMWKLPLFVETNIEVILSEATACRQDNPGHHVRLVGYDNYAQYFA